MTRQQRKEQKRKAKQLARLLGHREFSFIDKLVDKGNKLVTLVVSLKWNGKTYGCIGWAKRNPTDKWNERIGVEIATGRALLRIAFQILKEEEVNEIIQEPGIFEELAKTINEDYGNVAGVIFVKKGPGPRVMFEDISSDEQLIQHVLEKELSKPVPGSAKYRGNQMQYGYGVIEPEYVPSGLEVIKAKEEADDRGDKAEGQPE